MTQMLIPNEPQQLSVMQLSDACRMVYDRRDEVIGVWDLDRANDQRRLASAIEKFLANKEAKHEAIRAARILETAVGAALGEAEVGGDRKSVQVAHEQPDISKFDRHRFRMMYRHRDLWMPELEESALSRRQVLEIIMDALAEEAPKAERAEETTIERGQWITLGQHFLYCGSSTDPEFVEACQGATFAFADPPYNADADTWDSDFVWQHDYLAATASVVAVTPGISAVQDFMRVTSMPYRWSVACHLNNGMTRGAIGFGNWIYVALFSNQESIHANSQDHYSVSVGEHPGAEHKGRKPPKAVSWLVGRFSEEGDTVIDPFAGSGTTLFVCEAAGRRCITAEIDPLFCEGIVRAWNAWEDDKHGTESPTPEA